MNRFLFAAWLLSASLGLVHGQSAPADKLTPPNPLFQAQIPAGRECVAAISYPALEKALAAGRKLVLAPYPLERTFAAQDESVGLKLLLSDKRTVRKYRRGGYILGWDSKYGTSFEPATGDNALEFTAAFPELDWVQRDHFAGEAALEGKKYLSYNDPVEGRRLFIDPESLLPARFEDRGRIYRYIYQPISRELSDLPPPLAREWERISGAAVNAKKRGAPL